MVLGLQVPRNMRQLMHTIMVPALGPLLVSAHGHKASLLESKSQPITISEASAESVRIMAHGRGLSSSGWPVIALDLLPPTASVDPAAASSPLSCFRHQSLPSGRCTSCRLSLHRRAFLSLAVPHYNPSCLILSVLMLSLWLKGKLRQLGLLSGRNCIDSF